MLKGGLSGLTFTLVFFALTLSIFLLLASLALVLYLNLFLILNLVHNMLCKRMNRIMLVYMV